ncbi:MAG TPA: hypothetical protein DCM05_11485 [Elusimicrobia bacterium]|nr:hypothetical protein [Elusimicrobiota bacterium]
MPCSHVPQLSYSDFSRRLTPKLWAQRVPYAGTLILTYRCNQRCAHCYCSLPSDDRDALARELTFKEISRIIDELAEAGCLWLLITGGEPLLREDFWDIYLYARRKGIFVELFSNGTLWDAGLIDRLAEVRPSGIEFSIYGATKETHERITGVEGSWERLEKGIRLALGRGLPLTLKSVLMSLNKHELPAMEAYAASLPLDSAFVYDTLITQRIDEKPGGADLRLSPEEIVALDAASPTRMREYADILRTFGKLPKNELLMCGAGLIGFCVDPYGRLQPCDSFIDFAYDLRKGSFAQGWNEAMPRFREEMEKTLSPDCLKCDIIPLCDNCPGYALLEHRCLGGVVDDLCRKAKLRHEALGGVHAEGEKAV